jgi:glutamine cyclotransferase
MPRPLPSLYRLALFSLILYHLPQAYCQAPKPAYSIQRIAEHDASAFTQGLVCSDDTLYESTGLYGQSSLRTHNPDDFALTRKTVLPHRLFGEDITLWHNTLWQLTWREHTLLSYDPKSLSPGRRHYYQGEGWGLTHNQDHFIMSDGSHCLQYRDPDNFALISSHCLFYQDKPLGKINAMDTRNGILLANLFPSDTIAVIDLLTHSVISTVDLSGLRGHLRNPSAGVLNGLCYRGNGDIILTGKNWDKIFVLRLTLPRTTPSH